MTTYVLLAGNNGENLTLVKSILAEQEVEIVPAPNLALALFLTQKNLPCAIVCDLELPDGTGTTFLQEVKADKNLRSIPFIFLLPESSDTALKNDLVDQGADLAIDAGEWQKLATILPNYVRQANQQVYRTIHSFKEEESSE